MARAHDGKVPSIQCGQQLIIKPLAQCQNSSVNETDVKIPILHHQLRNPLIVRRKKVCNLHCPYLDAS